jgi:hypothetical protein
MADAISTEARAKFHEAQRHPAVTELAPGAEPGRIAYLDYWSPNVNIHRRSRTTLAHRPVDRRNVPHYA